MMGFCSPLKYLVLVILALLSVAFLTLFERKLLGLIGIRFGPNKVSLGGIFQPIFDAVKLSNKQVNILSNFSFIFYFISGFMMFFSSLVVWSLFFTEPPIFSVKFSLLLLMILLGLNSLNSILAGWSTFSKFSLIGSIRTVAQLVSYEAVLYVLFFFFVIFFSSFSIYSYFFDCIPFFFMVGPVFFYIWIPTVLAELNRTPYDFSEGESELVSGFNTEFGSSSFTLIFLAEYSNILFFSFLTFVLFFFFPSPMFFFQCFFLLIMIRSVLPRFRFDKLMMLAWKFFVPLLTLFFLLFLFFSY